MRVGLVSTYPPMQCGIGTYTRHLARAIAAAGVTEAPVVITERSCGPSTGDDRVLVRPVYSRDTPYAQDIVAAAVTERLDVIHFQHAADLFGEDERFIDTLRAARAAGVRTVVTLHTVVGGNEGHSVDFQREVGRHADALVAHQRASIKERLVLQGVSADKIARIAHGTSVMVTSAPEEARRRLGLPTDARVLLFFGFVHGKKNVHTVVEAFARIASRHPKAHLVVAGRPWDGRWYNKLYLVFLRGRMAASRARDRAHFISEFIPDDTVADLFGAAEVVLLPHNQAYGSASGVFHQALGAGRAFLCASGPKFENAEVALGVPEAFVAGGDVAAWAAAIDELLSDDALVGRIVHAGATLAAATSWDVSASKHVALYGAVVRGESLPPHVT